MLNLSIKSNDQGTVFPYTYSFWPTDGKRIVVICFLRIKVGTDFIDIHGYLQEKKRITILIWLGINHSIVTFSPSLYLTPSHTPQLQKQKQITNIHFPTKLSISLICVQLSPPDSASTPWLTSVIVRINWSIIILVPRVRIKLYNNIIIFMRENSQQVDKINSEYYVSVVLEFSLLTAVARQCTTRSLAT